MQGLPWRDWSGVQTTWVMYQQVIDSTPDAQKRRLLMEAEDWAGLRLLDTSRFKEADLNG